VARTLPGTALQADRVIPDVALLDPRSGAEVPLSGFRHREALVLSFLHEDCAACSAFARALAAWEEEVRLGGGRSFVVLGAARDLVPGATRDLPLPVLVDPGGVARARFLGPEGELPLVLVVDRFGAAWRSFPAPGHRLPPPEEVVATVWHLGLMCPECGAPTW
jgi:hypothetical protein